MKPHKPDLFHPAVMLPAGDTETGHVRTISINNRPATFKETEWPRINIVYSRWVNEVAQLSGKKTSANLNSVATPFKPQDPWRSPLTDLDAQYFPTSIRPAVRADKNLAKRPIHTSNKTRGAR